MRPLAQFIDYITESMNDHRGRNVGAGTAGLVCRLVWDFSDRAKKYETERRRNVNGYNNRYLIF